MANKKKQKTESLHPDDVDIPDGPNTPLIFISHDSRDADLADAFATLLTDASGGILKSFRSSDKSGTTGIEFGTEWYQAIMRKLDEATDVVALLTTRSLNRPWILYETGVAKGKLDSTVFGLALGVPLDKAATGPFAQFQNCGDDEDSITKLVLQLIRRHPDAAPREMQVMNTFNDLDTYKTEGVVEFTLRGQTLRLRPFTTRPKRFYFVFRDASSGQETYAAARFLYSDLRDDGTTVLDFNQAYNPPCAFNPFTTCPIPLPENRLGVKILAGERAYPVHPTLPAS
jgi:hypothetical protein